MLLGDEGVGEFDRTLFILRDVLNEGLQYTDVVAGLLHIAMDLLNILIALRIVALPLDLVC